MSERKKMSKTKDQAWKTKYGLRRVRNEAPTLEEAFVAAEGLSDKLDEQVEIAAALMGMPHDQVRAEMKKRATPTRLTIKPALKTAVFTGSSSAPRAVVVERKPTRRVVAGVTRSFRVAP